MKSFDKTLVEAEKTHNLVRFKHDLEYCKNETYSSINHMNISIDKIVDILSKSDISKELEQEIDNIYYHLGKIKALSIKGIL